MSKYMKITVTVNPYYQEELEKVYPKLARNLSYLDAPLVKSNPSLYGLVTQLDKLLYAFDGTKLRDLLLPHREKLQALHKSIEENIANWNLAQADRLLYNIEDIFDEIEAELN
jgi:primosomal protein N''